MTKHTPGPWRINSDCGGIRILTAEGLTIAKLVADPNRSLDAAAANARLIAEAPGLVSAISNVMTEAQLDAKPAGLDGRSIREVLAAIARGQ